MTDKLDRVPFVARFASPLPDTMGVAIRYDDARQVAQVQVDRAWVDAPHAPRGHCNTRVTKVRNETTDDE